jgi:type I restriction enzyme S subunit
LEAELEARKKQYEYYRNQLLTFDRQTDRQTDRVRWVSLGEIIILEYGKPLKENERDGGCYPVLGSNGKVGSHSSYLIKGPCIIMGRKGSAGAVVWEENNCYPIDTTFFVKQLEDNIVLKYLFYILQIINFGTDKQDGGVPGLNRNNVYKIKIPVPPLAEQERIVTALDKFDALVNDISVGLPAELSARRKQYEYYRDQLLTFKPLEMQNAN